jgi:tRNA(Arg) A34 adenosine deaminase TadA
VDAARLWAELDEPWREAFRQAWAAVRGGNIGVGACAATVTGEIVHAARNRVNDTDGPHGEVFGSSLAHAELNVLARLGFRRRSDLVLTTTLQPCLQCSAAIRMARIATVRFAGHDVLWDGYHEFGRLAPRETRRSRPAREGAGPGPRLWTGGHRRARPPRPARSRPGPRRPLAPAPGADPNVITEVYQCHGTSNIP